ncbi:MAG TPA: hypothetical protein VJ249_06070 [Candidatus Bathyarchaeia archaeon]|nr:hypothetical protein [Candidatus Bathyarchaeia archaeon]
MPEKLVMKVDKPHFTVKLHDDLLEVDLKNGAKKELEEAVEASPILRESLGVLFQTIVPLDIPLKDIDTVKIDKKGQLKVLIPLRRDITIPLDPNESKKLAEKLNQLIPSAKERDAKRRKVIEEAEDRPKRKMEEPV